MPARISLKEVFGRNGSVGRRRKVLFTQFLTSPELKEVGKIISKRLGRKLEAYDIWYDGSNLVAIWTRPNWTPRYKNFTQMQRPLKPGFPPCSRIWVSPRRANEICDKIAVDAARGSGHAWGAAMKGQQSTSAPVSRQKV